MKMDIESTDEALDNSNDLLSIGFQDQLMDRFYDVEGLYLPEGDGNAAALTPMEIATKQLNRLQTLFFDCLAELRDALGLLEFTVFKPQNELGVTNGNTVTQGFSLSDPSRPWLVKRPKDGLSIEGEECPQSSFKLNAEGLLVDMGHLRKSISYWVGDEIKRAVNFPKGYRVSGYALVLYVNLDNPKYHLAYLLKFKEMGEWERLALSIQQLLERLSTVYFMRWQTRFAEFHQQNLISISQYVQHETSQVIGAMNIQKDRFLQTLGEV